jgi:prepilin-type processing-associated H-X9-DG protein
MNDFFNEQQANAEEQQSQSGQIIFKTSRLAITAFILGLFSFCLFIFTGIPAIILGIIALVKIEQSGGRLAGRIFAIAGIVIPFSFIFLVILMLAPTISRFKQQIDCGYNLQSIGRAMLLYATDYQGEFPRSGSNTTAWASSVADWKATNRKDAFGLSSDNTGGTATISSCFYLLIKHAEAKPKMFVCKPEGADVWKAAKDGVKSNNLTTLWDFGLTPRSHCSYAYHLPFGNPYYLTTSSESSMIVSADSNPFITNAKGVKKDFNLYDPGTRMQDNGNTAAHRNDGENVLFLDGHVEYSKSPDMGINQDCIYTCWSEGLQPFNAFIDIRIRKGMEPVVYSAEVVPKSKTDSYLVNDEAAAVKK